jgi:tetratricopeptide (TPR) repeat protein
MLDAVGLAFALAACLESGSALAQLVYNNDYYKSAGTELLRSVERYHVGPAGDKLRTHQYESAWGDIEFTLRFFPNHPQGLSLLMQLCEQRRLSACAPELLSDMFARAVTANPEAAPTYVAQGIYLYRIKKLPEAITSLEKAATLDPDSVNAQYNLGLIYFETRQYELANAHAQRAYQLGAAFPGLRDKLKKAGQWKPLAPPPDVAPSASSGPGSAPAAR